MAAFLHGDAAAAVEQATRAIAIDPNYAPTYDLIGAAYTRLGQFDPAREAFNKSLAFDAHDSTAYENLGVLELNAGNRAAAAKYFAEALWLVPDSQTSRQGLAARNLQLSVQRSARSYGISSNIGRPASAMMSTRP